MILKKRTKPVRLEMAEAALRRLSPYHPSYMEVKEDYQKRLAGFQGEQQVDYYLSLLPAGEFFVFHDLRLPYNKHFFQLDALLLSQHVAVILEMKNLTGTLLFDRKFNQLIRILGGKEKGFPDPFLQMENQKQQLQAFFSHIDFHLPIEILIVVSQPETIIKATNDDEEVHRHVLQAAYLPTKLIQLKKAAQHTSTSPLPLEKAIQHLLHSHVPETASIWKNHLTEKDIQTGVHCPNCQTLPMKRIYGRWLCLSCKHLSKDAERQAIADYFSLIRPSMSNRQCREFLHLTSRHTANRILSSMNLKTTGRHAKRIYSK